MCEKDDDERSNTKKPFSRRVLCFFAVRTVLIARVRMRIITLARHAVSAMLLA